MSPPPRRSGARILADQLRLHGADLAFGVPGESYLALLDALYDMPAIRFVTCRQEGGAAMMADAYGKLTGRPGICMVTRGPGAANATAGLHVAFQDSTPLILLIGQVGRGKIEREAFQEIDYRRMLGQMAKWVAQIDEAARIPEFLSRAFHTATAGRPGPVVLALPEDMLNDQAEVADALPYVPVEAHPGAEQMARLRAALETGRRPLMLLGGSRWDAAAVRRIEEFATANALPVATGFRRADRFDNAHPNYAGDLGIGPDPKLIRRVAESDLLLVVGSRLGEMTTGGYGVPEPPVPRQRLIHVHPDPQELGRVYEPQLAINATPGGFAAAAAALEPVAEPCWAAETVVAHRDYLAQLAPIVAPGALQMSAILRWLDQRLPADAIFCNGAGNSAAWLHRFHQYRGLGTQLAPASGSMGYGMPATVAAKLVRPECVVIGICGDGDFMMTGQELATAVQEQLDFVVLIVNNAMYGTIRMHQERHYPGRVIGTGLRTPDFAALARAYGGHGETVERTADFAAAFERAAAFPGPAILDLKLDPEAITPRQSLSEIRAAARAAGR